MNLKTTIMNTAIATEMMNELPYFSGTIQMWEHRTPFGRLTLTDGCNYVRQKAESRWLFDLIQSYQPQLRGEEFQTWTLERVSDMKFMVTCTDGNDRTLVTQSIQFSDFPLQSITIWLVDGVCLLPSEY